MFVSPGLAEKTQNILNSGVQNISYEDRRVVTLRSSQQVSFHVNHRPVSRTNS